MPPGNTEGHGGVRVGSAVMLNTPRAARGMVTAPHHLAAQAGLAVLREGGNAIEAMVAASAVAAVLYPHMTGLGGDGFWLMAVPGKAPLASLTESGSTMAARCWARSSRVSGLPARARSAAILRASSPR